MQPAGIAFDAFGTLFDLNALRTRTRQAASHEGDELFAAFKNRLIPWTWFVTAADGYEPFPELASKAVYAAARDAGLRFERSRADWIVEGMRELPAFEDVRPGLERLRERGVPLAVLSNGTPEIVEALVAHNGLAGSFDHLLAADSVPCFKPAPAVYAMATRAFRAPAERVMLVSHHEWDVAGAARSGLQTAWLGRGQHCTPTLGHEPDIEADDLVDLVERMRA